jgi:hypothetical protein
MKTIKDLIDSRNPYANIDYMVTGKDAYETLYFAKQNGYNNVLLVKPYIDEDEDYEGFSEIDLTVVDTNVTPSVNLLPSCKFILCGDYSLQSTLEVATAGFEVLSV